MVKNKIYYKYNIIYIISIFTLLIGCASTNYLKSKNSEDLEKIWLNNTPSTRHHIVQLLEDRKAVDSLKRCLVLSGAGVSGRRNNYTIEDVKVLVESLGRLKDPSSIDIIMPEKYLWRTSIIHK